MRIKLLGLGVITVLAIALYWQVARSEELQQKAEERLQVIEQMTEQEAKRIAQQKRDDQLLAKVTGQHQQIQRENYELRQQLQQIEGCSSTYIDAATAERVREYRSQD